MTNLRCPNCGGKWFTAPSGIALSTKDQVTGFLPPLVCRDCGTVLGASGGTALASTIRERARYLATTNAGTWVTWKTYPPEQATAARVAASDIRTGKIKTIAQVAGPVEARTVRLPDGSVQVQVARSVGASADQGGDEPSGGR